MSYLFQIYCWTEFKEVLLKFCKGLLHHDDVIFLIYACNAFDFRLNYTFECPHETGDDSLTVLSAKQYDSMKTA